MKTQINRILLCITTLSLSLAAAVGSLHVFSSESQSLELRMPYGSPQQDLILLREGYIVSYDPRTKNPWWTYEVLTPNSIEGDANRKRSSFYEDTSLPTAHRSTLSDFKGSGYDRGHLAPAGDYKSSQVEMDETFLLSNISPGE